MAHLSEAWSVLREPLTALSFATMKEVAAASGLPTVELSQMRARAPAAAAGPRSHNSLMQLTACSGRLTWQVRIAQRDT